LPDGSCGDEAQTAFVAPGGGGAACTKASPCGTLRAALATNKPVVKFDSGVVADTAQTTIDGRTVMIVAEPDAVLDCDAANATILEIRGNSDVTIADLTISGQTGLGEFAIRMIGGTPKLILLRTKVANNQGGGITSSGGTLTVSQSTLSGNQGGGISVSGVGASFSITNNFIFRNGDVDNSPFGGLNLGIAVAGTNRLEFNTIVDNRAVINSGGVVCNVATFTGANNIIARNVLAGSTTNANAQTSGACTYPSSIVQSDVTGLAFVDPEGPAPFDYHIGVGSTAVDQGVTSATTVVDVDGDARPQGAANDVGADELAP
jgi:hypothetical protein